MRRSLTGAWIETLSNPIIAYALPVAPSRGRGLKRLVEPDADAVFKSLPHGGVD